MTDFRALCAELADALAEWQLGGGPPEDTADADLINRARAALAQPEPVAPTDEELTDMAEFYIDDNGLLGLCNASVFARAVLARWGTPTLQPVPVSERLPLHLAGELDDQGTCWNYHPINLHYCLCVPDPSVHTHWLPHHALPVPQQEVQ